MKGIKLLILSLLISLSAFSQTTPWTGTPVVTWQTRTLSGEKQIRALYGTSLISFMDSLHKYVTKSQFILAKDSLVNLYNNQTIAGQKTFTGYTTYSSDVAYNAGSGFNGVSFTNGTPLSLYGVGNLSHYVIQNVATVDASTTAGVDIGTGIGGISIIGNDIKDRMGKYFLKSDDLSGIRDSTAAIVSTIADMQAYTGPNRVVIVTDPNQGGIFYRNIITASYNVDGGTIFSATGLGIGFYWIRHLIQDGVYNPLWFGCKGDGTTNDRVNMQKCIEAVGLVKGTIAFPAREFVVTGGLKMDSLKNISFHGLGGNYSVDPTDSTFNNAGTRIVSYSPTDTIIDCNATGVKFLGIAVINRSATLPTAGYGILLRKAGSFTIDDGTVVMGSYRNVEVRQGVSWNIHNFRFINPVKENIRIVNPLTPDQGDWAMSDGSLLSKSLSTAFYFESSGGGKISNVKIQPLLGNKSRFDIGFDILVKAPGTSDMQIINCSVEGYKNYAARVRKEAAANFSNVYFGYCQFAAFTQLQGASIYAVGIGKIMINNCGFDDGNGSTVPQVKLDSCNYATVLANNWGSGIPQALKLVVTNHTGTLDTLTMPASTSFIKNIKGTSTIQSASIAIDGPITANIPSATGSITRFIVQAPTGNSQFQYGSAAQIRSALNVPSLSSAIFGPSTSSTSIPYSGGTFTPNLQSNGTSTAAGLLAYLMDGTNNRRAGLYVDGAEWGLSHLWSTSALPFVIRRNTTIDLKLSTAGLLQLPAYTTANSIPRFDASGNITATTDLPNGTTTTTQPVGDATTKIATTNFVQTATNQLPVDSRWVQLGDSQTARGLGGSVSNAAYQNWGFTTYAALYNKSAFYVPINGNQGVAGNTLVQILARISATTNLKPTVVTLLAGTNDLTAGATLAQMQANYTLILSKLVAANSKVIAITIAPRFSPNALTAPQEVIRVAFNTWLLTQATSNIQVVNQETAMNNAAYYVDGLHFNSQGAQILGALVGAALNNITKPTADAADLISADNSYTSNFVFAGTNTATNWTITNSTSGATVTPALIAEADGTNSQQFTISGSYSGATPNISFYQANYSTTLPAVGDVMEAISRFQIVTNDPNIVSVDVGYNIWNSAFTSLATGTSNFRQDRLSNLLTAGAVYTTRTPPVMVTAGVPAFVRLTVTITLKDQVSSTAINSVIKILRAGVRKVPFANTVTDGTISDPTLDEQIANLRVVKSQIAANVSVPVVVSAASTLTLAYGVDYVFSGTTATYTLPPLSASNATRKDIITIKNRGSGTITLNSNTGTTIYDGSAVSSISILAGSAVTLVHDGTYFNKE